MSYMAKKKYRCWSPEDWEKVIFSDKSRICIGSGDDAGTFMWRLPSEKFHFDCLFSKTKFSTLMIWGCMSAQRLGKVCILKITVNVDMFCAILENFLVPTLDEQFGADNDVTFQDDNASFRRAINLLKPATYPCKNYELVCQQSRHESYRKCVEGAQETSRYCETY